MKAYPINGSTHFVIHIAREGQQGIVVHRSKLEHARKVIERYPPYTHNRRKLIISELKKESVLK